MGYYPNMGVMSTIDCRLYVCHKLMEEYFDSKWIASHAVNMECEFKNNGTRLIMRSKTMSTLIWVQNPEFIKCILSKLKCIQNAIRDWLHRRKTPTRHEAALFLQARLPRDLVKMVLWSLH
jgi:hypothetical protein